MPSFERARSSTKTFQAQKLQSGLQGQHISYRMDEILTPPNPGPKKLNPPGVGPMALDIEGEGSDRSLLRLRSLPERPLPQAKYSLASERVCATTLAGRTCQLSCPSGLLLASCGRPPVLRTSKDHSAALPSFGLVLLLHLRYVEISSM